MLSRRLFWNCSKIYTNRYYSKDTSSALTTKLVNEFDTYAPKIIDQCLDKITYIQTDELRNRLKKVHHIRVQSTEYYTVGRRPVQGEFLLFAFEAFSDSKQISDELLHKLKTVVLATEIVQTYGVIWDDYEDNSELRCGKKCWHLVDDNGTLAIIDCTNMRSFADEIIRMNMEGKLRDNVLHIFNLSYFIGCMGQYLDTIVSRSRDYDRFTIEQYNEICRLKSSFYAVKSPILLGLALSNKLDEESYRIVDEVCTDIGILVQIHNDLLDYFNTKGTIKGKSGTDIQEGKCSWVAVAVLKNCSPEQRRIFTENYGSWDPEKFNRIRELYESMDLVGLYKQEEKARYNAFYEKVNGLPKSAIPSGEFFKDFYNLMRQYTKETSRYMYDK